MKAGRCARPSSSSDHDQYVTSPVNLMSTVEFRRDVEFRKFRQMFSKLDTQVCVCAHVWRMLKAQPGINVRPPAPCVLSIEFPTSINVFVVLTQQDPDLGAVSSASGVQCARGGNPSSV